MDISIILSIVIAIVAAGVLIHNIIKGKTEAKELILRLVIEAEKVWIEKGQGSLKYAYVIRGIKAWMPGYLEPFFSDKVLNTMIEEALDYMKKELSEEIPPAIEKE